MIAFFKGKNISGPFLIAAPLSTIDNRIDEFAWWRPDVKTIMYHGLKVE
jgi:ATP-dependent DNA helicase